MFKGFDYFKVTAFAPFDDVCRVVDDAFHGDLPWVDGGPARFISRRRSVMHFCDVLEYNPECCGVELKGTGCTMAGADGLARLGASLDATGWRLTGKRFDFAWDGFPLSPREVWGLLRAGAVRTSAKLDPAWQENEQGTTCYTHDKPERRGIERYIRWYDMRGPTRLELVLHGAHAEGVRRLLSSSPPDRWPRQALGILRDFLDILDGPSNRVDRSPLHPAWADFIAGAERLRVAVARPEVVEPEGMAIIGAYDAAMQRVARRACEAAEAFGIEWVIDRIKLHGRGRENPAAVAELKRLRGALAHRRIAGVPPWPDEVDGDDLPF